MVLDTQWKLSFLYGLLFLSISCNSSLDKSFGDQQKPPNILFLSIDDLRPELGCYGKDYIHSPNIDRLARSSTVFLRHYVQVPTCGASRYAMLTGMLPISKEHLSNQAIVNFISNRSDSIKGPETFIHHFKNQGYHTVGLGKISHSADGYVYGYREEQSDQRELPNSWSELDFDAGQWGNGWNAFFAYANGVSREPMDKQVKPYESAEVSDEGYPDGLTANLAIEKLKTLTEKDKPFFLGVGFFKPHLPFSAPQKYWDLYDRSEIALAPYDSIPKNSAPSSLQNMGEFNGYKKGDEMASLEDPLSDEYARLLRHGYYASISYTDAQVGKVLATLDEIGLSENTIIVLWGDHGYNLGDYRVWGKHTMFDKSLNSALMIKLPGAQKGRLTDKIISSIDLYPTLMELTGNEMPHDTDGKSFASILQEKEGPWEEVAYGYWRNGLTVRNDRYRLMKFYRTDGPQFELYDHVTDPLESVNIAAENPEVVAELSTLLEKGNTGLHD